MDRTQGKPALRTLNSVRIRASRILCIIRSGSRIPESDVKDESRVRIPESESRSRDSESGFQSPDPEIQSPDPRIRIRTRIRIRISIVLERALADLGLDLPNTGPALPPILYHPGYTPTTACPVLVLSAHHG